MHEPTTSPDLDWLISVDDHILEPPTLWTDRVAAKDRDQAPHMETRDGVEGWVYADRFMPSSGLSAVAAAMACLAVTLGMMRFATNERPDSTAAMVRMFATPGSNLYPVSASPRVRMPRALDEPIWATPADIDAHYTLSAVVTREVPRPPGPVGLANIFGSSTPS